MNAAFSYRKTLSVIVVICVAVTLLTRCNSKTAASDDPRGNVYIGSASCRQCHQSVYNTYTQTSHYQSIQVTSAENVKGSFARGKNIFEVDANAKIAMEQRDNGLFQVLYVNGKQQEHFPMDLTFGVKHAQTFLYWKENKAFELPISYYNSVNTWASSPGYPSVLNFERSIGKGCFECHSSYIESKLVPEQKGIFEAFNKESLINGIDCERCHGPATNHVNFHLAYPEVKEAKYMKRTGELSRQQRLDGCAVCHSGNDLRREVSTFNFKLGDTLSNLFSPYTVRRSNQQFDVHGNQYHLMAQSNCFLGSKTMDCSTCHNAHTNASNNLANYSAKCMSCHETVEHDKKTTALIGANTMNGNCIDCHMPYEPSRAITFQTTGSNMTSAYSLRTHRIAVYSKNF